MQIGIDLGATKVEYVLLDNNNKELERNRTETPKNFSDTIIDDYKCKIYGKVNDKTCIIDAEVEDIYKYLCIRGLNENKTDQCCILLIDEKRYLNLDFDKSFINRCNKCVTSEIKNLCKGENCNYAAIIGFDDEKCNLYQDISLGLESGNSSIDYNKLPIINY